MPFDPLGVPPAIRKSTRCVLWRREVRDGKATKVPYQPRHPEKRAAVNDPRTWGSYAEAVRALHRGAAHGVGVMLGAGRAGVDLDHCREDGVVAPWAQAIIDRLESYTELSPSGTGVHILVRGTLPPGRRRHGPIELYSEGRFFTLTGWHVPGTPRTIGERTAALADLHREVFPPEPARPVSDGARRVEGSDQALIERAKRAKGGTRFAALWAGDFSAYPSQSEADMALARALAFWTRGDAPRVDALFRQSGLMRPKWDRSRGSLTYGERTVETACQGVG